MLGEANSNPARAISSGVPELIGTSFTTDASGLVTMLHDHDGQTSVAKASNTYTVSFPGPWSKTQCVIVTHALAATVNHVLTVDEAAGTVAIAFSGAIASSRVDVFMLCEMDQG